MLKSYYTSILHELLPRIVPTRTYVAFAIIVGRT